MEEKQKHVQGFYHYFTQTNLAQKMEAQQQILLISIVYSCALMFGWLNLAAVALF